MVFKFLFGQAQNHDVEVTISKSKLVRNILRIISTS
jgi:hypothetical protein